MYPHEKYVDRYTLRYTPKIHSHVGMYALKRDIHICIRKLIAYACKRAMHSLSYMSPKEAYDTYLPSKETSLPSEETYIYIHAN